MEPQSLVQQLYLAYYGRPADPGGLAYWSEQLQANDGNLDSIINFFGDSDEFTQRYGDQEPTELVNNLYQQLFGRDAEEGGLEFYTEKLNSGELTLAQIASTISQNAANEDSTTVNNRVEVANRFTQDVQERGLAYGPDQVEAAGQLVASVASNTNVAEYIQSAVNQMLDTLPANDNAGPGEDEEEEDQDTGSDWTPPAEPEPVVHEVTNDDVANNGIKTIDGFDFLRGDVVDMKAVENVDFFSSAGFQFRGGREEWDEISPNGTHDLVFQLDGGTGRHVTILWGNESPARVQFNTDNLKVLGEPLADAGLGDFDSTLEMLLTNNPRGNLYSTSEAGERQLLVGGDGPQTLYGGGGDDILVGGKGDDVFLTLSSSDVIFGGQGADVFYMGSSANDNLFRPVIKDYSFDEGDVIDISHVHYPKGSEGLFNHFEFRSGEREDVSGTADDLVIELIGDEFEGSTASSVIVLEDRANSNVRLSLGDQLDNTPFSSVEEAIVGRGEDANIVGDSEYGQLLIGGDGTQTLTSGAGDDVMIGGKGEDTFKFEGVFGDDIIFDWSNTGETGNVIDMSSFDALTFDNISQSTDGDNLVISTDEFSSSITLIGVSKELIESSFTFAPN
ncbi:DUF4214 domain-containing protein [Halomonas sp. Bachu 37]|uniref:DUF4214 domain-containing protein n=1 Tax=Halomonas kashgarensis TaxID=3084920 RepID=UPI00321776B7